MLRVDDVCSGRLAVMLGVACALSACGGGSPAGPSSAADADSASGASPVAVAAAPGGSIETTAPSTAVAPAAGSSTAAGPATVVPGLPGGTLHLRIAGTQPGLTHDVLAVAGKARLAGALVLEFTDNYVPKPGQRFALITAAGGIAGAFLTVTSSDGRLKLSTSQDATTFYVTVGK